MPKALIEHEVFSSEAHGVVKTVLRYGGEFTALVNHQMISIHDSRLDAIAACDALAYELIADGIVGDCTPEPDPTPDYNDDAGWQRIADDAHGVPPSPEVAAETEAAIEAAVIERQLADARAAYREARDRGDTSAIQRWTTIGLALIARRDGVAAGPLVEPDGVPRPEGGPGGDPPPDDVLAALADFIRQVGDVIPDETSTGKAFWRGRSAAAARAAMQIAKGVRVTLLPNGDALVPSASGSAIYRYDDRARRCSCSAGAKGHGCWHVEAISATRAAQQVTA